MSGRPEAQPVERVPWSIFSAVGLWVLGVVGSVFWIGAVQVASGDRLGPGAEPEWLLVAQVWQWAVYGIGPFVVARAAAGRGDLARLFPLEMRWSDPFVFGALGVALQLLVVPLVYLPFVDLIDTERVGDAARSIAEPVDTTGDVVALFVLVVVFAPLVEEVFYRGFVQPALANRLGPVGAIVVSAAWFALSHLQGIQLIGLLTVGLTLGVVRWRTRRLVPAMAVHVAFNAVTFAALTQG